MRWCNMYNLMHATITIYVPLTAAKVGMGKVSHRTNNLASLSMNPIPANVPSAYASANAMPSEKCLPVPYVISACASSLLKYNYRRKKDLQQNKKLRMEKYIVSSVDIVFVIITHYNTHPAHWCMYIHNH